ncbi:hypothetical protein L7F22_004452 [Adiantum nelumboides]|nr:hypothetical protein [Adiantum nelumboides]
MGSLGSRVPLTTHMESGTYFADTHAREPMTYGERELESEDQEEPAQEIECKQILDEISVIDVDKQKEDEFVDSLSDDLPSLDYDLPMLKADDKRSIESETKKKYVNRPEWPTLTGLIQNARLVARPVRTTTTVTSSRARRSSKKSSSDDKKNNTNKEDNSKGSDEESPKGSQAKGPSKFEKSDKEDTSTPLDRKGTEKSKKSRSETQIAYAEAQARVEERKKKLADARAAKKAASTRPIPLTMKQARQAKIEKAKELQVERKRIASEQKAQERDKNLEEQRATALAWEKIKEGLKRTTEQAILEPQEGQPKRQQHQEEEENIEDILMDRTPPSHKSTPPTSPPSPKSPVPPISPLAPSSSQQQSQSTKELPNQPPSQPQDAVDVPKEVAPKQQTQPLSAGNTLQVPTMTTQMTQAKKRLMRKYGILITQKSYLHYQGNFNATQ